ncbi:MAG: PLP-dependent aminotransferase family protein [Pseudomonadota bacterium]
MGNGSWTPDLHKDAGPLYLAIADALARDIAAGTLKGGERLPPQRQLAARLGIDFTTVSRAYTEARRRGLVDGRVGRGTYVRTRRPDPGSRTAGGPVDMSMNNPPGFDDAALTDRMAGTMAALLEETGSNLLLRYQEPGGAPSDRAMGCAWLTPRLPHLTPDTVLICPGAQGALLALVSLLARPGDTVCAEAFAYPGFRALAAHLGLAVTGIAMDDQGLVPDAFEAACRAQKPKLLYCNPTLHNPTTSTLPPDRRSAIVAIARSHGVPIIEDDAYGALPKNPVPPLAAHAPDLVYHIAGLAKCLAPALRIAYLAVPDRSAAARVSSAIRATAGMASPLAAAIASRWIDDGTAARALDAIRLESARRQEVVRSVLPPDSVVTDPEAFHVWLHMPAAWTRGEFAARLRAAGIGVVVSDAFSVDAPIEAVRLGLGAPGSCEALRQSLQIAADLLADSPALSSAIV